MKSENPFLFLFLLLLSFQLYAQQETSIWYFGWNAGVDFRSGNPVSLTNGALSTSEGCATISDATGNLLFYTDGSNVWNRNHQIMPNGSGLLGDDDSTQSALIVPRPGSPNIYYIFTVDDQAGSDGMNYSEVNLDLDGGLGEITPLKNINLIPRSLEKITAVKSADGSGIWVVGHPWESNRFYSFSVNAMGVNTVPVESVTPLTLTFPPNSSGTNSSVGQLKVSPDGSKIGMCTIGLGTHIFDFNVQTGTVSNMLQIASRDKSYGLEFSPSGKLIYVTTGANSGIGQLHQYNMEAPNIAASETLITEQYALGYALQLAVDGKIYTPVGGQPFLSSIENPDVLGVGCNFTNSSLDLNGRIARAGLPPFIQSYFYVDLDIRNLCHGDVTEFYPNSTGTNISWDFGDGTTSLSENPTHTYSAAGDYTVSAIVNSLSGSSTKSKQITIYETPIAHAISDFQVCTTLANYEFDLSTKDIEVLGGQLTTNFTIAYYPTMADAQNGTNALSKLHTNSNTTENVTARISNKIHPSCFDTERFDLMVKEAPLLNQITDWTVCDTNADGLYDFELTQKDSEIRNGQSSATFAISYYETLADAQNDINSLVSPYTNMVPSQQLFFRIKNTAHPECFETGNFNIEVITVVRANTPSNMTVCDDNNDGIFRFDLSSRDNAILNGQSASSFKVSYHTIQAEADNGTNSLTRTSFTNTSPYAQTIFARVQNNGNSNCYATTHFDLVVHDSPILQTATDWEVCDDDNDGFQSFDLTEKNIEILGDQRHTDFTITYHETQADADADANAIVSVLQNTANPQTFFYRVENKASTNCYVTDSFAFEVFDTPTAGTPAPIIACDENEMGILTFDLSVKDSEVLNAQDPNTFLVSYFGTQNDADNNQNQLPKSTYENTNLRETLYARVQNRDNMDCYDTTPFEIIVNPLPQTDLEAIYVICPDSPELNIDGGDFETWSWNIESGTEIETDRYVNITDFGNYTLTVTQTSNGITCEKMVPFEVVSSGPPEDFTTEIGDPSDNVIIIINTIGAGDFEYSADGENYQDNNRLEVFPGKYTVYVRDKFLCRTISKEVIALGYQNFFTPNGDGIHEHWNIIGAYFYPESQLFIYDRYGKLLQRISPMTAGWDGTYNGLPLPSSDYWFRYVFDDGKVFTGHFSMKR